MEIEKILNESDREFRKSLYLSFENIESNISKIAVQLFDINHVYATSNERVKLAETQLKKVSNHVYNQLKQKYESMKIKVNEKILDAKTQSHSTYLKALDELTEGKVELEYIRGKKEAIELKAKMIELAHKTIESRMYFKRMTTKE